MGERRDPHADLHSEQGGAVSEHPGRAPDPVVKVQDLAWLEFEKPDLARAGRFAEDFGFAVALSAPDELHLRGSDPGAPCVVVRRGRRSRFLGAAFRAAERKDLARLAAAMGERVTPLPESLGGAAVTLRDPSGGLVRVVSDPLQLSPANYQQPLSFNSGHRVVRTNATQRPPRAPATVQRLGHVVLQTTSFRRTLDWYLETLGLIVSDFQFYADQRERGPVMAFIRCDRGTTPADHHTLALTLGPSNRYVHSAYQVSDLDALAAGGEYLLERGYRRSWGIGRHIQGSQIFDYWRDPDGFLVEHFTDGDLFDATLEPGWAPMTASGLAQWGPPPTRDFLGLKPGGESLRELGSIAGALSKHNEFDLGRLRGLMKVATT
jgi:catechol 2,3-dioxygenase-like lactoylglutathione lyase family enzyme